MNLYNMTSSSDLSWVLVLSLRIKLKTMIATLSSATLVSRNVSQAPIISEPYSCSISMLSSSGLEAICVTLILAIWRSLDENVNAITVSLSVVWCPTNRKCH